MPFFVLTPQLQAAIEANARAEAAEDWLDIMTAASEFHVPTGRIIAEYRIGRLPFKIVIQPHKYCSIKTSATWPD